MTPIRDGNNTQLASIQERFESLDQKGLFLLCHTARGILHIFSPGTQFQVPNSNIEAHLLLMNDVPQIAAVYRAIDVVLNNNVQQVGTVDPTLLESVRAIRPQQTKEVLEHTTQLLSLFTEGTKLGEESMTILQREGLSQIGLILTAIEKSFNIEAPTPEPVPVIKPVSQQVEPTQIPEQLVRKRKVKKEDAKKSVQLAIIQSTGENVREKRTIVTVGDKKISRIPNLDKQILVGLAEALQEVKAGRETSSGLTYSDINDITKPFGKAPLKKDTAGFQKRYLKALENRLSEETGLPIRHREVDGELTLSLGHEVVVTFSTSVKESKVTKQERFEEAGLAIDFILNNFGNTKAITEQLQIRFADLIRGKKVEKQDLARLERPILNILRGYIYNLFHPDSDNVKPDRLTQTDTRNAARIFVQIMAEGITLNGFIKKFIYEQVGLGKEYKEDWLPSMKGKLSPHVTMHPADLQKTAWIYSNIKQLLSQEKPVGIVPTQLIIQEQVSQKENLIVFSNDGKTVMINNHRYEMGEKGYNALMTLIQSIQSKGSLRSREIEKILQEVYGRDFPRAAKYLERLFKLGDDLPIVIPGVGDTGGYKLKQYTMLQLGEIEPFAEPKLPVTVEIFKGLNAIIEGDIFTVLKNGLVVNLNSNERRILLAICKAKIVGSSEIESIDLNNLLMAKKVGQEKPALSAILQSLGRKLGAQFIRDHTKEKGFIYSISPIPEALTKRKQKIMMPIRFEYLDALSTLCNGFSKPGEILGKLGALKTKTGKKSYLWPPYTAMRALMSASLQLMERKKQGTFSSVNGTSELAIVELLLDHMKKHNLQTPDQLKLYIEKKLGMPSKNIPNEVKRYRLNEGSAAILAVAINHIDPVKLQSLDIDKFTISDIQTIIEAVDISLKAFRPGEHRQFIDKQRPIALKKLRDMIRKDLRDRIFDYSTFEVALFLLQLSKLTKENVGILIKELRTLPVEAWEIIVDQDGFITGTTKAAAAPDAQVSSSSEIASVNVAQQIASEPVLTFSPVQPIVIQQSPMKGTIVLPPQRLPQSPTPTSLIKGLDEVSEVASKRRLQLVESIHNAHLNVELLAERILELPDKNISIGQLTPITSKLGITGLTAQFVVKTLDRASSREKPRLSRSDIFYIACIKQLSSQGLSRNLKKELKRYIEELLSAKKK